MIVAAEAYRDALAIDNNATEQDKQASRDYVYHIDRLQDPNSNGGRRPRSSAKKHASRRKPRSAKKRATRRYRHRRRA